MYLKINLVQNHVTYKDFLKYLEQFTVPKDQMFQQMVMMQPPRRNDDVPSESKQILKKVINKLWHYFTEVHVNKN